MSNPFAERRPWAAAVIAFFFSPFIGMLYLNRAGIAFLYFAANFAVSALAYSVFQETAAAALGPWPGDLLVRLVGALHAYALARSWHPPPRWYARWYALALILLFLSGLAFAIRTFLYQPFNIMSTSNSPALDAGDYIVISKFPY